MSCYSQVKSLLSFHLLISLHFINQQAEFIQYMKTTHRKHHQISDFKILLKPLSIVFHRANNCKLKLYLQKGAQVIGQFQQIILPCKEQIPTIFTQNTPLQFRVCSQRNSNYLLSIYQIIDNAEEKFCSSVVFSLADSLKDYYKQFLLMEETLFNQLKDKENKENSSIVENWKGLSLNFTKKHFSKNIHYKEIGAIVEVKCEISCEYDQMVIEEDRAEMNKKVKQEKREINISRTNTMPLNFIPQSSSPPSFVKTMSYAPENNQAFKKNATNSENAQESHDNNQPDLIQISEISKDFEGNGDDEELLDLANQQNSTQKNNFEAMKIKGKKFSNELAQPKLEQLDIKYKKSSNELLPMEAYQQKQTQQPETNEKQFETKINQQESPLRKIPQIHLKNLHSLIAPETKRNTIKTKGSNYLDVQSDILKRKPSSKITHTNSNQNNVSAEGASKIKETILNIIMVVVLGGLLIFLLHPISKI